MALVLPATLGSLQAPANQQPIITGGWSRKRGMAFHQYTIPLDARGAAGAASATASIAVPLGQLFGVAVHVYDATSPVNMQVSVGNLEYNGETRTLLTQTTGPTSTPIRIPGDAMVDAAGNDRTFYTPPIVSGTMQATVTNANPAAAGKHTVVVILIIGD